MRRRALEGAVRAATRRTRRKTWGGVSPIPHAPSIRGVQKRSGKPAPALPTAAKFPGFVYNGGPVIASPQVYTSFWGPLWTQDQVHKSRADRLSRPCRAAEQARRKRPRIWRDPGWPTRIPGP